MELNVREEKLKGLFKQFQVEHNENCKTVFLNKNKNVCSQHTLYIK
ncbi:hypothetical protein LLE97_03590 [Holdemanella biformis]|nr:hypothetical protein [Holdemanella biformis]MCC3353600.1 hypothetical protein [Holdemanella biformis]